MRTTWGKQLSYSSSDWELGPDSGSRRAETRCFLRVLSGDLCGRKIGGPGPEVSGGLVLEESAEAPDLSSFSVARVRLLDAAKLDMGMEVPLHSESVVDPPPWTLGGGRSVGGGWEESEEIGSFWRESGLDLGWVLQVSGPSDSGSSESADDTGDETFSRAIGAIKFISTVGL